MEVNIKDGGSTKTFYLSKETKVSIDGNESHLFSLNEGGDLVKVEILDNLALNISAESKDGEVIGILKDKKFDKEYLLTIERQDNTTYEYTLNENIIVHRNFTKAAINDLRKGDKVNFP